MVAVRRKLLEIKNWPVVVNPEDRGMSRGDPRVYSSLLQQAI